MGHVWLLILVDILSDHDYLSQKYRKVMSSAQCNNSSFYESRDDPNHTFGGFICLSEDLPLPAILQSATNSPDSTSSITKMGRLCSEVLPTSPDIQALDH